LNRRDNVTDDTIKTYINYAKKALAV